MNTQEQWESTEAANTALITEVTSIIDAIETPSAETDVEIAVHHLAGEQRFVAVLGEWEADGIHDREIGAIRYRVDSQNDVDVYSTFVHPEFRGRGITVDFLADVLDALRATGRHVTESCPVAAAYVAANAG